VTYSPRKTWRRWAAAASLAGAATVLLIGCGQAPLPGASGRMARDTRPSDASEPDVQKLAESVLGSQAEILARGNLAGDGREQLLVVNRVERAAKVAPNSGRTMITRAAILEKGAGKWTEALLCDEHLKNSMGYLRGAPVAPVTGWLLAYQRVAGKSLQLLFTPVGISKTGSGSAPSNDTVGPTIAVRWNTKLKRYQAFDRSQDRFLGEVPTLVTPESRLIR
jgi:hypothetical protein